MNIELLKSLISKKFGTIKKFAISIEMTEQNLYRCFKNNKFNSDDLEKIVAVLKIPMWVLFDEKPVTHMGQLVAFCVNSSGFDKDKLSEKTGYTIEDINKFYKSKALPVDVLRNVSDIIEFDIWGLYNRLNDTETSIHFDYEKTPQQKTEIENAMQNLKVSKIIEESPELSVAAEDEHNYTMNWKNKYLGCLEKYNNLLEEIQNKKRKKETG